MDAEYHSSHPIGPEHYPEGRGGTHEPVYNDPSDTFWALYLSDADKNDIALTESLKGDSEGVLIFTGLFAAIVGAFNIEVYKLLKRDSGDDTVTLLTGISGQLSSLSNGTSVPPTFAAVFTASSPAVRINPLWFISLFLSLSVALAATLMQQWSRRYLHAARRRGPPHKRGPVHVHLYHGMKVFHIERAVEVIIGLLHTAVFLFLAGLVQFLFLISPAVAHAFLPFICIGGAVYLVLSVLPGISPTSPYDTPLTPLVRFPISFFLELCKNFRLDISKYWKNARRSRKQILEDLCKFPSAQKVQYAAHLTLKVLDEQLEVEEFLAGLPGLLAHPSVSLNHHIAHLEIAVHMLAHEKILRHAHALILSCITSSPRHDRGLSTPRRIRRIQVTRVVRLHGLHPNAHTTSAMKTAVHDLYPLLACATQLREEDDVSFVVFSLCAFVRLKNTLLHSSDLPPPPNGVVRPLTRRDFFCNMPPYFENENRRRIPAWTLAGAHLANLMWFVGTIWVKHRMSDISQENFDLLRDTLDTICESLQATYDPRELYGQDWYLTGEFTKIWASIARVYDENKSTRLESLIFHRLKSAADIFVPHDVFFRVAKSHGVRLPGSLYCGLECTTSTPARGEHLSEPRCSHLNKKFIDHLPPRLDGGGEQIDGMRMATDSCNLPVPDSRIQPEKTAMTDIARNDDHYATNGAVGNIPEVEGLQVGEDTTVDVDVVPC